MRGIPLGRVPGYSLSDVPDAVRWTLLLAAYFRFETWAWRRLSSGVSAVQSLPHPGFLRFFNARTTNQAIARATMMSATMV